MKLQEYGNKWFTFDFWVYGRNNGIVFSICYIQETCTYTIYLIYNILSSKRGLRFIGNRIMGMTNEIPQVEPLVRVGLLAKKGYQDLLLWWWGILSKKSLSLFWPHREGKEGKWRFVEKMGKGFLVNSPIYFNSFPNISTQNVYLRLECSRRDILSWPWILSKSWHLCQALKHLKCCTYAYYKILLFLCW